MSQQPHADASKSIDAQAAFWDARLRSPNCRAEDRSAFETWRDEKVEHRETFEALQDALEALRSAGARPTLRALRDDALRARAPRTKWAFAAAAGIAALILIGVVVNDAHVQASSRPPPLETQRAEHAAVQERTYATAVGQRSSVRLEDGSVITLNTQSRVNVSYTRDKRAITLVSGEALFDVAHDTARPFIVRAGDRDVRATGTEFNVRVDGGHVRVVLVEGRVEVERNDGFLAAVWPGGRQELRAGQQLIFYDNGPAAVSPVQVDEAVLWREGRVAFRDVSLTDAVREMNRYSPETIVVTDPSMARLKVNGVFRTGQMTTFLGAVKEYFPVDAETQSDGDVLLVWRE